MDICYFLRYFFVLILIMDKHEQEIIQVGKVTHVDKKKSLVKVDTLGVISDWLPVLQQANSFKKQAIALRKAQQVVVLANLFVIGSIFNSNCKEPAAYADNIDVTEYEDGTTIKYDSSQKKLGINCKGKITVNADAIMEINSSKEVKVTAPKVRLNGGTGVVTGAHICAFTGAAHSDYSEKTTSG